MIVHVYSCYEVVPQGGGDLRDLRELNMNVGGDPVDRPAPTPEEIAAVESVVAASLPATYVDFLRFSNGGQPELDTFYVSTDAGAEAWNVNSFFHISSDTDSTESVMWVYNRLRRYLPERVLPIAGNGGGDVIALDLRAGSYGHVILWVHDEPAEPLRIVSSSFEEFVGSLEVNPDYI